MKAKRTETTYEVKNNFMRLLLPFYDFFITQFVDDGHVGLHLVHGADGRVLLHEDLQLLVDLLHHFLELVNPAKQNYPFKLQS